MGTVSVVTVPCDAGSNTCNVTVPAPSFALVFLTDSAVTNAGGQTLAASTYATTAATKLKNTATIDAQALQTSNGMNGKSRIGGASTSKGGLKSKSAAPRSIRASWAPAACAGLVAVVMGVVAYL
jgi:hypothetical protein